MKYLIVLADGMADLPIEEFGNRTPLQAAYTPNMDWLVKHSRCGMLTTVPPQMAPGSEVANLSVLGYDVAKVLEGRGSLEAASMQIPIEEGEMVMRCNLICVEGDTLKNHSAGHISTDEADELIRMLDEEFRSITDGRVSLHTGVSYRHLIKIKGGDKRLHCSAPHDFPGQPFRPLLIRPMVDEANATTQLLNELILRSQRLLENHPVNINRVAKGKDSANSIWPWSPGYRPMMQTLMEKYPIQTGTVISAVDLIRGIGVFAGLKIRLVEGATGLYDTNYEGKIEAAFDALATDDFVFLHIEASDEAGHEGDYELKKRTVENLDSRVLNRVVERLQRADAEPLTVALLPDHPTPCVIKTHTRDAVPFMIYKPNAAPDAVEHYDEYEPATHGAYGQLVGDEFMAKLFE